MVSGLQATRHKRKQWHVLFDKTISYSHNTSTWTSQVPIIIAHIAIISVVKGHYSRFLGGPDTWCPQRRLAPFENKKTGCNAGARSRAQCVGGFRGFKV